MEKWGLSQSLECWYLGGVLWVQVVVEAAKHTQVCALQQPQVGGKGVGGRGPYLDAIET